MRPAASVVTTPNVSGRTPRIEGTRIGVFTIGEDCGVVSYRQDENPSPSDLVAVRSRSQDTYGDHRAIETCVPDGWM